MKTLNIKSLLLIPIEVGLIFTMFINGLILLIGGNATHLEYLNHYNRTPIDYYPSYFTLLLYITAVLQVIGAGLLCFSFVKREFLKITNPQFIKWGIFLGILSITIYGFMVRVISNHGAAANLYFYLGLLYFYLWFIEQDKERLNTVVFNKIKTIPIFVTLFYTMGFPGWQKIFNSQEVMGNYIKIFSSSFFSKLPGGIEPFIYLLGVIEISVPILLLISIVKKEFLLNQQTHFLDLSFLVSVTTFIMLCFGLSVILNYPGATNLVFYSLVTLGLYTYVAWAKTSVNVLHSIKTKSTS